MKIPSQLFLDNFDYFGSSRFVLLSYNFDPGLNHHAQHFYIAGRIDLVVLQE